MSQADQRGYALLLVAFVVTLLSLILLTVARVHGDAYPAVRRQEQEALHARLAHSAAARMAFMLATEPVGPRSLLIGGESFGRELMLDGRPYAWGEAVIAVQDEAGLINLNSGDAGAVAGALAASAVPSATAEVLSARLQDYIDPDNLVRDGGAEREDYFRQGREDPPNRELDVRWAAMGALGWRELSAPTRDALWRITSVADTESLNVNTAPLAVLEALVGERARALAAAREQAPIVAQENLEAAIGIQTRGDGLILAFRPSDSFRLTVMFPADGRELESQLVITGRDADRPYYWREIQPERAIFAAVRASWALPQSEALNAP